MTTLKKAEVIIIGNDSNTNVIASYLAHTNTKLLHIKDLAEVRFVGNKKISHLGEKIDFKRALVTINNARHLPYIKGLEQTDFVSLPVQNKNYTLKNCVIYGQGLESVDQAIKLAANNKVTLIHKGNFLKDYDISIYDSISRHLKAIGVTELKSTSILASTTKTGTTTLLTKSLGTTKKLACNVLFIENERVNPPDIGLANHFVDQNEDINKMTNGIMVLDNEGYHSMGEAIEIAKRLAKNKKLHTQPTYSRVGNASGACIFSFGLLEQDLSETHHSYKKSIAKTRERLSSLQGYIKVLANSKREIISISGVLKEDYPNVHMFYSATRDHMTVQQLLDLIPNSDELSHELLEIEREIR